MIPITIISGFLGAGKTTFLQKLLACHTHLHRVLIIENDFGKVSFDSALLQSQGAKIRELTSGCICCSLQGDFKTALLSTLETVDVDTIYIEPSGVGKLSDIISACQSEEIQKKAMVAAAITIVDATQAPLYAKNFGEFFIDQVHYADTIFLSHQECPTQTEATISLLKDLNPTATIHTEAWDAPSLFNTVYHEKIRGTNTDTPREEEKKCCCEETHIAHHHHEDTSCDHHHEHEDIHCCDHHHEHEDTHCCGHHHEHTHTHHAKEVFVSLHFDNLKTKSTKEWQEFFHTLPPTILRIKGTVPTPEGIWEIQYNGHHTIMKKSTFSHASLTVIGTELNEDHLHEELEL